MGILLPATTLRAVIGGVFMGLANLVPGISGGTMLLATGVYTHFVGAVAEITTFELRARSLLLLAAIALPALATIGIGAGAIQGLVEDHRWVMYSLFIGLTLGGVPVVWRMARRATPGLIAGGVVGLAAMIALASSSTGGAAGGGFAVLLLAGIGGASAMVLPGVSGATLLLILGVYETVLGAVKVAFKSALALDLEMLSSTFDVVIPVGLGVVAGIAGVSNAIRWMLQQHAMLTYGLLLGLLLGSVLAIYPFQQPVEAESRVMELFAPAVGQIAGAIGLAIAGFAITSAIDRIGRNLEDPGSSEPGRRAS